MRLRRLLLTSSVTVLAFALAGANARVATAWDTAPAAPACTEPAPNTAVCGTVKGSVNYDLHLPGNTTGGLGGPPVGCNTNAMKDPMGNPLILDADLLCSHVIFTTTITADISSVVTYPAAMGFNTVDLILCTVGGAPDEFCYAGPHVVCDQGGTTTPDANDNLTATINCAGVPPGTYELLVDPFFFTGCEIFACPDPVVVCNADVPTGSCVTGTLTVNPTSGSHSSGGSGGSTDRMTGGGHVDQVQDDNFALEVWEGASSPKGQVKFSKKGTCMIRTTQINWVMITPILAGGAHAEFDGYGEMKPKTGNSTWGHIHGYADDNGEGGSNKKDRFRLTDAPGGCVNADDIVTKGNVKAHLGGS
jgi:hypothetical protein